MSPDLQTWLGQIPWGPLAIVVVGTLAWTVSRRRKSRSRVLLKAKLEGGALVVDVRSKAEFAGGHYPGAMNVPVDTLSAQVRKLGNLDRPLVVYCASGGRSAQAASILRGAGFTEVTNAGAMANLPPRD